MTTCEMRRSLDGVFERRFAGPVEVRRRGRTVVGALRAVRRPRRSSLTEGSPTARSSDTARSRRSARAPRRVMLNYEHREDLGNLLGPATELVERSEVLWGTFRVVAGALGDHALEVIRSGAASGLSISAALHPAGAQSSEASSNGGS